MLIPLTAQAAPIGEINPTGQLAPRPLNGTVFVTRRGWHIDLGFAVDELAPPLRSVAEVFPGAQYLLFGFGDRRYLAARHRGVPVLLRALWPGPGLLLVTALRAPPAAAFGAAHVVRLTVSTEGSLRAQAFVWQSMTEAQRAALGEASKDDTVVARSVSAAGLGAAAIGLRGPYEGSRYFESRQTYSAAYTCNTWAAIGLGSTGAPVKSHGVVLAGQLWDQVVGSSNQPDGAARPDGAAGRIGGTVTGTALPPIDR